MMKLIVAFRNFVNAAKNDQQIRLYVFIHWNSVLCVIINPYTAPQSIFVSCLMIFALQSSNDFTHLSYISTFTVLNLETGHPFFITFICRIHMNHQDSFSW